MLERCHMGSRAQRVPAANPQACFCLLAGLKHGSHGGGVAPWQFGRILDGGARQHPPAGWLEDSAQ
eukprot:4707107-Lingulodinium_polyedra.AAC.1